MHAQSGARTCGPSTEETQDRDITVIAFCNSYFIIKLATALLLRSGIFLKISFTQMIAYLLGLPQS
jgi:hypothetical protein